MDWVNGVSWLLQRIACSEVWNVLDQERRRYEKIAPVFGSSSRRAQE